MKHRTHDSDRDHQVRHPHSHIQNFFRRELKQPFPIPSVPGQLAITAMTRHPSLASLIYANWQSIPASSLARGPQIDIGMVSDLLRQA